MSPLKFTHRATKVACYVGYVTQAITINLMPLLYVTFRSEFNLTFSELSTLIAANFIAQLAVDLLAARIGDRISMRALLVFTHAAATVGLALVGYLPSLLPSPFVGLLVVEVVCGMAGGFTEVLISPLLEALPTEGKSAEMSLLHSFYCWGQAAVVLFSTLFFAVFGIGAWRILPVLWAAVPFAGLLLFTSVPIYTLVEEKDRRPTSALFRNPRFWLFILMMFATGASEMLMSQWASSFCETSLSVSKTVGDLCGPCMFAVMMGIGRVLGGKLFSRVSPTVIYTAACLLCIVSYLLAAFPIHPAAALLGCALCGLSVGPFWPATLSRASEAIPAGGVSMFALLAVAGDLGCLVAPSAAGVLADLFGGNLTVSFLFAILFPAVLCTAMLLTARKPKT